MLLNQHYAGPIGNPSKEYWEQIIITYELQKYMGEVHDLAVANAFLL